MEKEQSDNATTGIGDAAGQPEVACEALRQAREQLEACTRELRRSEDKYRTLFDSAADAIFIHDATGRILAANASARQQYGYSQAELLAMTIAQLDTPEHAAQVPERLARLMDRGAIQIETVHRRKDGSTIAIDVKARRIEWEGRPAILGICRDVTASRRAEETLRATVDRTTAMLEAVPDMMFRLDRNGVFLDYKAERADLYAQAESIIGKRNRDVTPPEFADLAERMIQATLETRQLQTFQYRMPIPERGMREYEARMVPVGADEVITIVRDVTDRRQAEEERERLQAQLLQAQKMESVGRLAGGVAHDYNNMLSVIQGYAEMALDRVPVDQPLHGDLQEILGAAQRATEVTRQLLAFARKQTIAPAVLDLNETVEGMLKMLRRLIGENIHLVWKPGKELWRVRMDPSQLDQILANLCVNARDAITGAGSIHIETGNTQVNDDSCKEHQDFSPGEYVYLTVMDDGCGMPPETKAHLFEPFFTTKKPGQGTGLGLATVYGIVKQNHGVIEVLSEPGRGALFRIFLPRHVGNFPQERTHDLAESPLGHGEVILLVEDDLAILRMTENILRRLGYSVLTATSAEQALRLAEAHPGRVALLLTDVVMPGMNGLELAQQLLPLQPGLKSLFMSGYTADVIATRGELAKGVQFLQKPFSRRTLAQKVQTTLRGSE